jgi:hypothetical protein
VSRQRAKGTAWASKIVAYLRDEGWPHAELRNLSGRNDRGDIAGVIGVCIEAKNQARHSLAEWLDEAIVERHNAGADVGAVWFHRRGKGSPGEGFVLMPGWQFVALLRNAGYGSEPRP